MIEVVFKCLKFTYVERFCNWFNIGRRIPLCIQPFYYQVFYGIYVFEVVRKLASCMEVWSLRFRFAYTYILLLLTLWWANEYFSSVRTNHAGIVNDGLAVGSGLKHWNVNRIIYKYILFISLCFVELCHLVINTTRVRVTTPCNTAWVWALTNARCPVPVARLKSRP